MSDVEDRLRGYRPAGPPPELRDRVVQATLVARPFEGRAFLRDWLPPAIAASVAIIFHLLASSARADVASRFADADRAREAMVADLASQLGGDELARENAERLVEANEQAVRDQADISNGSDVQVTNHD